MIDISKKITNELPVIKISENLIVSVNNRKSNVLTVQAMIAESENAEKSGKKADEFKFMDTVLRTLTNSKLSTRLIVLIFLCRSIRRYSTP